MSLCVWLRSQSCNSRCHCLYHHSHTQIDYGVGSRSPPPNLSAICIGDKTRVTLVPFSINGTICVYNYVLRFWVTIMRPSTIISVLMPALSWFDLSPHFGQVCYLSHIQSFTVLQNFFQYVTLCKESSTSAIHDLPHLVRLTLMLMTAMGTSLVYPKTALVA